MDWAPIQCSYGPHWHEQPGAEEAQENCRKALYQTIGPILARFNVAAIISSVLGEE